jgi:signal-transduction protein with cAMP-binding, CBS, and nucleotidyltransferase domain
MAFRPEDPTSRLMHGDPVCADLGASLRELAETMSDQEVGSVIIIEMGQVVGIVTERDLVTVIAEGGNPVQLTAADVMSEGPVCADPGDTIRFTVAHMMQEGVQHVPVIRAGRAVGMVSMRDVARALAESERWVARAGSI